MLKKTWLLLVAMTLIPWTLLAEVDTLDHNAKQSIEAGRSHNVTRVALVPPARPPAVPPQLNLANLYYHQGNSLISTDQFEKAIEFYNQAIDLDPNLTAAYHNRGNAYTYIGRFQLAEVDYSRVISLEPDFIDAYHNRGLAYIFLKQYKHACRDFEKACELGDCSSLSWAEERDFCPKV